MDFYTIYNRVINEISFGEIQYSDISLYELVKEHCNDNDDLTIRFLISDYGGFEIWRANKIKWLVNYNKNRYYIKLKPMEG